MKRILVLFTVMLLCTELFAQRYNFQQFDIEDGLTQSQITSIIQDKQRRLWVSTFGGISSFDGRHFANYGRTNGLNSNFTLSLSAGGDGSIYIGTARGINRLSGNRIYDFKTIRGWTSRLAADRTGNIYAIRNKQVYVLRGDKDSLINISGSPSESVTRIRADHNGTLWASVYQQGIFKFEAGKWQSVLGRELVKDLIVTDLLPDRFVTGKLWILTGDRLYISEPLVPLKAHPNTSIRGMSMAQDDKGALWIGAPNGAYYISGGRSIHFNSSNGFTSNMVNDVFKDAENNIWFGTDGSGLFKYTDNGYVTFDETQGLSNRIIMSLCNGPEAGTVWLGTPTGIFEYKRGRQIKPIRMPGPAESQRINFLFTDSKGNIWIGTPGGGLWVRNKSGLRRVDKQGPGLAYNAIMEDSSGTIWLSTNYGCLKLDAKTGELKRIIEQFGGSLLELGKDSVIAGTQDGAFLVTDGQKVKPLKLGLLQSASVLCMLRDGDHVIFGTADYGLIIWNTKTNALKMINTKSGFLSDHIYSILKDRRNVIWVGTGKGIARLNGAFEVLRDHPGSGPMVECNQNAILQTADHIWIGTTKGAVVYRIDPASTSQVPPHVSVDSVVVIPNYEQGGPAGVQKTAYKANYRRSGFRLPFNHNHINISYTGIYLRNPDALSYQYRLVGSDAKFSQPTNNSTITFSALPPGEYTFEVKAITKDGELASNTASFSFVIETPYYQTGSFKALMILLILGLIVGAVYVIIQLNERRRKLRLKIKLEEQFKVRKQTAEDFHDDLGNKLTRINVLSEVLCSMIAPEDTEKRTVIAKIRKNVDELYLGTRDILWSLNPKNDDLSQLLNRISEFGQEMFNDTPVNFSSEINLDKRDEKLSLPVSRNLMMILKESINNILKHAKASEVVFTAVVEQDTLKIMLENDGPGFNLELAKEGHGINNMYVRAKRIEARLHISSGSEGTKTCLTIPFTKLSRLKNV
ncbi:ligand-binding sensor domain-containing protein [Pedobacter faecalis]|uniref:ligand-binding sensor domain-containing protein n=1 Tax=Pedobacter faecalis TaxID=3041495 RepID=UPI00254E3175|nr:sensor histidine kinase [Pedobacter sp. ELA7]